MDCFTVAGSRARWMRSQGWEMRAVNSSNKELIPRTSDAEWHSSQKRQQESDCLSKCDCVKDRPGDTDTHNAHTLH